LNNKSALASSGESALGLAKSSSWVVSQDWNKNPEIKVNTKKYLKILIIYYLTFYYLY
jgi:hypothetical protein